MSGSRSDDRERVPAEAGTLFSIGEVAEATGISVDTLRAWERRYGRPRATRLPSGHRRYTLDQVRWLRRVSEALAWGYRPSRVVLANETELDAILERVDAGASARRIDEAEMVAFVKAYDRDALTRRLERDWRTLEPVLFLEERIAPLLTKVGRLWSDGDLDVRHEHFLTEVMQDQLRSLRVSAPEPHGGPVFVLATISGETHGLGLQMLALLCALHGVKAHLLGIDTPPDSIVRAASETNADAVVVSVSLATGGVATDRQLAGLRSLLPADVRVVVGGSGARGPRRGLRGVQYLDTLGAFDRWLRERARSMGPDEGIARD